MGIHKLEVLDKNYKTLDHMSQILHQLVLINHNKLNVSTKYKKGREQSTIILLSNC